MLLIFIPATEGRASGWHFVRVHGRCWGVRRYTADSFFSWQRPVTERPNESRTVDVSTFTRVSGQRQGVCELQEMERLSASLAANAASGPADWTVQGEQRPVIGGAPEICLHLQSHAQVALQCQRCLQPVTVDLAVDRRFRFVRTEAEAARLDEDSEDDVLVLEPRLDLLDLLEDELILALPIVPMHSVCPQPLPTPTNADLDEAPAPNPFAVLAALRKKSTGGEA